MSLSFFLTCFLPLVLALPLSALREEEDLEVWLVNNLPQRQMAEASHNKRMIDERRIESVQQMKQVPLPKR